MPLKTYVATINEIRNQDLQLNEKINHNIYRLSTMHVAEHKTFCTALHEIIYQWINENIFLPLTKLGLT